MEKIPLPTKVEFLPGENKNTSIVIIEPCYPGYGTTIGNALRRILLSSLPGAAVKSFKIKGALHEFSSINNIKEDLVEISLNLKLLRLKVFSEEPVKLELKVKGEKKVSAGDIKPNSDVEIANPELHIATLTDKEAELDMEIIVSKGRGYITTESREKEELEVGMIAIDSLYSPIQKIGYKIENVRVGQMTNWDKLILTIETDGTITTQEALNQASNLMLEHFVFIEANTQTGKKVAPAKEKALKTEKEEPIIAETAVTKDEVTEKVEDKKEPKKRGRPRKKKE